MPHVDVTGIREWLLSTEAALPAPELLDGLIRRLIDGGIDIWRSSTAILTLHPELVTRQVIWNRGSGARVQEHMFTEDGVDEYLRSPARHAREYGQTIRRRLDRGPVDFKMLNDLADAGATDYAGFPLPFSDGQSSFFSIATDVKSGFDDASLSELEALLPALAVRLELESAYHARRSLLSVYLGSSAAERVLAGAFRRGTGEIIACAIWFCDLRNFTGWVDTTAVCEVLSGLDQYFDATAGAVIAHGGEVLKFIGDAVLAIFPIAESAAQGCARALAAAERALASLEEVSRKRGHAVAAGVALHVGEVMFGNIGASSRLDFTVIGAAVNEVTRIESLCKPLGTPLLLSEAFVRAAGVEVVDLGPQRLKGVSAPIPVATLPRLARLRAAAPAR